MSDWSFRRVLFRSLALAEPERIERGREMPAHAIGADQHHRADRIVGGALDLGGGERGARLGGGGLHRDLHLLRIERGGQVVAEIGRASCRERVCRSVWISVVAVSSNKKTIK